MRALVPRGVQTQAETGFEILDVFVPVFVAWTACCHCDEVVGPGAWEKRFGRPVLFREVCERAAVDALFTSGRRSLSAFSSSHAENLTGFDSRESRA